MATTFDFVPDSSHTPSTGKGNKLKKLLKNKKFLAAAGVVALVALFVYSRRKGSSDEEVRMVGIAEYPKIPEQNLPGDIGGGFPVGGGSGDYTLPPVPELPKMPELPPVDMPTMPPLPDMSMPMMPDVLGEQLAAYQQAMQDQVMKMQEYQQQRVNAMQSQKEYLESFVSQLQSINKTQIRQQYTDYTAPAVQQFHQQFPLGVGAMNNVYAQSAQVRQGVYDQLRSLGNDAAYRNAEIQRTKDVIQNRKLVGIDTREQEDYLKLINKQTQAWGLGTGSNTTTQQNRVIQNKINTDAAYRQSELARTQQVIANRRAQGLDTTAQTNYLNKLRQAGAR